ncbi:MFS family permease [Rehaibacterium terrae]|jgi:MFS family permease|uniref:MFS family permease n=1 Tax=Rehaibacterium terrae TaxID=1341696 RepID=A0A7W8DDZ2_9GAMM|nr:MFS family permease [Rehaibacterium terrae]
MASNQFTLLKQRRFLPFFLTQALGAFNDNVFKNALVIMIAFKVAGLSSDDINFWSNLAAGLFILPFFLFSANAGQWAEKFEKSRSIRWIKLLEIFIMCMAAVGFWLESVPFLLGVLFLMGLQSTLFGPIKYSILPQHLRPEELVGGNALVEAGTFLTILLGTLLGGVLMAGFDHGPLLVSATVIVFAVLGWWASHGIPEAPPTAPDLRLNWNPLTETVRNLGFLRGNRTVLNAVLGVSWFWFFGAAPCPPAAALPRPCRGGRHRAGARRAGQREHAGGDGARPARRGRLIAAQPTQPASTNNASTASHSSRMRQTRLIASRSSSRAGGAGCA